MTTATRVALRTLRARHGLVAVAALMFVIVGAATAFAYWTATGSGSSTATAATLGAPTGVTANASGATVTVGWTGVAPPGATLTGYYVTRYAGATPSNACGTVPGSVGTYVAAGTLTCDDTGVVSGTYTYRVTAVFRTWTAQSASSANVVVNVDPTPPTQAITLTSGAGTAYLGGTTIYYRGDLTGSFTLASAVTDAGSGPASASFPALSSNGWTHTASNPTSGTGSAPTITYQGGTYSWSVGATSPGTHTVTARDVVNNTVTTNLSFASDVTAPVGGALTVDGTDAAGGGASGQSSTGTFTGSFTTYTDAGSGVDPVTGTRITRAVGTLSNGVCSGFGAAADVPFVSEVNLAAGCYRYTAIGTDRVGNSTSVSVTIQVDKTAPTQTLSENGPNTHLVGSTLYFNNSDAGSSTLSSAVNDTGSGPGGVTFPVISAAGWTHDAETVTSGTGAAPDTTYTSSALAWTAGAATPGTYGVVAADQAGNTATQNLTFTPDSTGPTGGSMVVSGSTGTSGGTYVQDTNGWNGTFAQFNADAGSGLVSSQATVTISTNQACTTWGTPTVLTGTTINVTNGQTQANRCYRYTVRGVDNVGNESFRTVTIVTYNENVAPTHVLSVNGDAVMNGVNVYYRSTVAGSFTISATVTDNQSGPARTQFGTANGNASFVHNQQSVTTGVGTAPTVTYTSSPYTWTANPTLPGNAAFRTVQSYDNDNNTTGATQLVFTQDNAAPTGGQLTANGVDATVGGATTSNYDGTFTVARTDYNADGGQAGVASSVLTRAYAPFTTGTTCGAFGTATTVAGAPSESGAANGCYRYVLTGTDLLGNSTSVTLTVLVQDDDVPPTIALSSPLNSNLHVNGTQAFFRASGGTGTIDATVTDNQTAPASAQFPALAAWGHANETVTTPSSSTPPAVATYSSSAFTWSGATAPAGPYTVTGRDQMNNSATASITTFTSDGTAPTGGALQVNGTNASALGTTSNLASNNPQITVNTRTNYTNDTGSGMPAGGAGSVLSYATATWNGTACGAFGDETVVAGNGVPAPLAATGATCYRYTLTGTDNVGNSTSISTTVRVNLQVRSVTLADGSLGGYSGVLNRTDTITVVFTGAVAPSSLCSTWDDDTSVQTLNGDNVVGVTIQEGTTTNDYVTVSTTGACGNDFNFGRIVMGADGYLTATAIQTFRGTGANASVISYNKDTYTMTITLGRNQTTPGDDGSNAVTTNTTAVYTPDVNITSLPSGLGVTGTGSTANVRQF